MVVFFGIDSSAADFLDDLDCIAFVLDESIVLVIKEGQNNLDSREQSKLHCLLDQSLFPLRQSYLRFR